MKKIITAVISLCIVLSFLTSAASADSVNTLVSKVIQLKSISVTYNSSNAPDIRVRIQSSGYTSFAVFAAAYSENGRLVSSGVTECSGLSDGPHSVHVKLDTVVSACKTYRAFIVGDTSGFSPLCSPISTNTALPASYSYVQAGGKNYKLGMTEASLLAQAGQPVETFDSILGFKWCAFTSQNYDDLFIAGIEDGTVTALCAAGQDTSLLGVYVGDTISFDRANFTTASGDQGTLWLYKDSNDGNIVHTLYTRLYCDGDMEPVNTKSALAGESKADFYLVNAFRRYHGLNTLTWSSIAGDAARGHSEDMASSNYFEHTGLDGSTPRTRLQAAGLTSFSCWGENIACGTPFLSGPDVHNNWVNSAGHRDNILTPKYTFFGGGAAYSETSSYNYYYTEDFCSD